MRSDRTGLVVLTTSSVVLASTLTIAQTSLSAIVEVVVVGLILAGLAALKSKQSKEPERVPVRVRTDDRPRRR